MMKQILCASLLILMSCASPAGPEAARAKLIELGIPFSTESFVLAARNGDSLAVALFMEAGMDADHAHAEDVTPLAAAALYGQTKIVRLLLQRGADPNAALPQKPTPLYYAASAGYADTARALLEAGADSSKGHAFLSPMAVAAGNGHVEVVRLFIDGTGPLGQGLAMLSAVENNQPAVVRLLAEHGHGVDIGIRAAEQSGKPYLVEVIREAGQP